MPKGPAMSMSLLGMITEPTLILDKCLAWFFASRRNQCTIIRSVESFVYEREIQQGTNITPETFCDNIADSLQRVIIKYFEEAFVEASPSYNINSNTMFTCLISCTAIRDGKQYDLARSVLINNKTFELIDKARHGLN